MIILVVYVMSWNFLKVTRKLCFKGKKCAQNDPNIIKWPKYYDK